MSKGNPLKHRKLINRYTYPTENMVSNLGLSISDILTVHSELPLNKLFEDCFSTKSPDIIYKTQVNDKDFYYIGELKSGDRLRTKANAAEQCMEYSNILTACGISNYPFIVTEYLDYALPAEEVYNELCWKGFYKSKT